MKKNKKVCKWDDFSKLPVNPNGTPRTFYGRWNIPSPFTTFPRNMFDYQGRVVLFDTNNNVFYDFAFGTGDNLDDEDRDGGFDDYFMTGFWEWDEKTCLADIFSAIRRGIDMEEVDGIDEIDGGQLLIKRKKYGDSGDIRTYIPACLEFSGYFTRDMKPEDYFKTLIHVHSED